MNESTGHEKKGENTQHEQKLVEIDVTDCAHDDSMLVQVFIEKVRLLFEKFVLHMLTTVQRSVAPPPKQKDGLRLEL